MNGFLHDVRYGFRILLKTPIVSVVAIVTLALGIGVTTAIFTFVDAGLLRALNFPDSDRLVQVTMIKHGESTGNQAAYPTYVDWRNQNTVFSSLAAYSSNGTTMHTATGVELVSGGIVTDDFFQTLGVQPERGSWFHAGSPSATHEIVISHGFSQRVFGGNSAIGQSLTLQNFAGNDEPYTVVGITPPDFEFAPIGQADFFALPPNTGFMVERRNLHWLNVVGRLKPDVSLKQASAEMETISARLAAAYPLANGDLTTRLQPLRDAIVGQIRPVLLLLLGAAACVLLIACANIANVQLAKAAGRSREVAVRRAVGASASRIARQFLVENVLLSLIAGIAAVAVARFAVTMLVASVPASVRQSMPFLERMHIDVQVLLFTFFLAVVAGVTFGLAPALRGGSANLHSELAQDTRTSTGKSWLRDALVVGEAGLAAMLLVGSGLLVMGMWRLVNVYPGFNRHNLLTLGFQAPPAHYQDPEPPKTNPPTPQRSTKLIAYERAIEQAIGAIPGVEGVAVVSVLPLSCNACNTIRFRPQGYAAPTTAVQPEANIRNITNRYFPTLQARMLKGRMFDDRETDISQEVLIVNRALADKYFGGDAVGKTLTFTFSPTQKPREIVGVVDEIKDGFFDAPDSPTVYEPFAQSANPFGNLIVRTSGEPAVVAESVRRALLQIDPDTAIYRLGTLDSKVEGSVPMFVRRLPAMLVTQFGALALLLAAVGVYGVVSYSVSQRTREFGIRMALGANTSQVLRLVMGRGARLVAAGAFLGLIGAAALVKVEASLIYGLRIRDALTFLLAAFLIFFVALAASYIPARRASRLHPLDALRYE
ncbi:MAG TPA: ABC transporter permease [Terriglobales bacterium]|jgi:predicted permease|nr:ABC transporter permease [Terriglobales bacterium]